MHNDKHGVCPVCGFRGLSEPAYDEHGGASFEICPCCGTEFGYDDAGRSHYELRLRWIAAGSPWSDRDISPPADWNALRQMQEAGLDQGL